MNKPLLFFLIALLCPWARCVSDEPSALSRNGSPRDISEFVAQVLGPRPIEFRPRGKECPSTNLVWLIGKWVWIEKRRTGGYTFSGGHFTIDCFCVFPYMNYAEEGVDGIIAAEFLTTDPSGKLTPYLVPVSWMDGWIMLRGPGGLVLRCAHEMDGEWELLRLWNRSEQGEWIEYVFFKFSDDPGEPLAIKGELRNRRFPGWEQFEKSYKRRLPPITGEYRAEYQHGSETLTLKENGSFDQIYQSRDGTLSLRNSGTFFVDDERMSFNSFMECAIWDGRRAGDLQKGSEIFHLVRRISGNVLTGWAGTYKQVKLGNQQ